MQKWFVSWVAYDPATNQVIHEHSSSDIYTSDNKADALEILDGIRTALQTPRPDMYIHIVAFNRV